MRDTRRRQRSGQCVSLSGTDPLNLLGVLTPGSPLAALTASRLIYRDDLPVAALSGGQVLFLAQTAQFAEDIAETNAFILLPLPNIWSDTARRSGLRTHA